MYNHRTLIRVFYGALLLIGFVGTLYFVTILESTIAFFKQTPVTEVASDEVVVPFPISVNPAYEVILEQDQLEIYPSAQLATEAQPPRNWFLTLVRKLEKAAWYQNLASPVARTIVIWPGERTDEAALQIGSILRWSNEEQSRFTDIVAKGEPVLSEGKLYPGRYVVHRNASPEEVAHMITTAFRNEILRRYTPEVAAQVPLKDALTIASLLEREASDFENMREVSGVIWNRLFIDMPLQLDATLQFARANQYTTGSWWPIPAPSDKFITSPYNTYKHKGLPPGPIANPSSDAVLAALNPIVTSCLFYFHTPDGSYYCSETYEEHKEKLTAAF